MMSTANPSPIDFSKVVPTPAMKGDDDEDSSLLREMLLEAERYLNKLKWCARINESYFGIGIGGIVAVFLFRITPCHNGVDDFVWVIVGDIPPLYITVDNAPNPACALDAYLGAMSEWAEAAISGKSISALPPVYADPTPENGRKLKGRLEFIDKELLSPYRSDLS
jgi:hypothetical protein